ncbi:MAG: hypothetical protein Q4D74_05335 [Comamonadaceae bacterium]|nr:hypothetical protein [Comamonadaceae bacterium]
MLFDLLPARLAGLMPLMFTLMLIGLSILAARAAVRTRRQVEEALRHALQTALMQRFGLPYGDAPATAAGHPGQKPSPPRLEGLGTLKSHRILRRQQRLTPPGKHHAHWQAEGDVLLHDEQRRFWLVLYQAQARTPAFSFSRPPPGSAAGGIVIELLNLNALPLNELRARRALFNNPAAYRHAFGQAPTRATLDAWRKAHPEQEPPEPADPWPR